MSKIKLDWFKLDCQLDDKMELIEAEFGLTGFAVVVRLYQKIYGGEGYYCEWNDDVALVFAKKNNVGASAVSEIVQAAIRRGIFSGEMFSKFGILTSHGIQVRYFECAGRRKGEILNPEYLLARRAQNPKNVDISSKNVNISEKNTDIFSQNRIEKNRRDKKRVRKEKPADAVPTRFKAPTPEEVEAYCKERNNGIDPQRFIDYYTANGWRVGRNPMKDWKAAVRTWEQRDRQGASEHAESGVSDRSYDIGQWSPVDLDSLKFGGGSE